MISASEARVKSIENGQYLMRRFIEEQKQSTHEDIQRAIEWGNTSTYQQGRLHKEVIDLLKSKGFTVNIHDKALIGVCYEITW